MALMDSCHFFSTCMCCTELVIAYSIGLVMWDCLHFRGSCQLYVPTHSRSWIPGCSDPSTWPKVSDKQGGERPSDWLYPSLSLCVENPRASTTRTVAWEHVPGAWLAPWTLALSLGWISKAGALLLQGIGSLFFHKSVHGGWAERAQHIRNPHANGQNTSKWQKSSAWVQMHSI